MKRFIRRSLRVATSLNTACPSSSTNSRRVVVWRMSMEMAINESLSGFCAKQWLISPVFPTRRGEVSTTLPWLEMVWMSRVVSASRSQKYCSGIMGLRMNGFVFMSSVFCKDMTIIRIMQRKLCRKNNFGIALAPWIYLGWRRMLEGASRKRPGRGIKAAARFL